MFPIRDHNPSSVRPYVTWALIVTNIAVFLGYMPLMENPRGFAAFLDAYALVPVRISSGQQWETLLTSMFLHGGLVHLAGNMLFLWIFGDNMEEAFGRLGFLMFYLAGGAGAGLAQVVSSPLSPIPTVGASGAIAAVMGGYLLMFPKARVDVLVIFIVFFRIFAVPAWIMLGLWFGLQLISGANVDTSAGGVAYWAHAGGFVTGAALAAPLWFRRGGPRFWQRTEGHPPHPDASYRTLGTRVPRVRRRR